MSIEIPDVFIQYLDSVLGSDKDKFLSGLNFSKRTSFRANTLKISKEELLKRLALNGFVFQDIGFADAVVVENETALLSKTIEHFLGLLYIQSIASMIPPLVLDPRENEKILDISAAPGSKTTQIGQMMRNRGVLVANDWDGKRIKTLSHNLDRMGIINAAMVNMGGERIGNLLPESFDKILVDAPCSALGVIHKAPQAVANLNYLQKFAYIQEQLIVSAIKAVKVGGTIVYSTCTVAPEENEKLIHTILSRYPVEVEDIVLPQPLSFMPGITSYKGEFYHASLSKTVRILPSEINPEGFFIAKLRKTSAVGIPEGKESFNNKKIRYELTSPQDSGIRRMADYFERTFGIDASFWNDFRFLIKDDEILITSGEWEGKEDMLNRIYTHRIGTRLARTRREDEWKLSTNAAQLFSRAITKSKIDLTDPKEIETFVEAGTIRRAFDIDKGGVVVTANGYTLGCGVMHQGNLKSQMPKSRTVMTVDIY
ncbi:RsmB/NOP family class I SAM-dependent RNA methyltransferase [bacterium]|nr:RsmB/NOP family class I SAM-dependent RNA methyltransferase [bacterium]